METSSDRLTPAALDDRLAARAAEGDAEAFGIIYDRYAHRVAALLRSFAACDGDLEDLVHTTFCQVIDGLSSYEPRGQFRSWLFTIALNVARKDARKRRRLVDIQSGELPDTKAVEQADTALQARETRQLAETLLRSLPEHERVVVVLRVWLELSYDEISSLLGIPSGTARRRMHTALGNLRAALERDGRGGCP